MRDLLCACVLSALAFPAAAADPGYRGPIIDAHAHIRYGDDDSLLARHPVGAEAIAKLDAEAGVTQSALIVIARAGQIEKTRLQNDAVIATAKAGGGRFYPVASVHPFDGDQALAELDRLAAAGVKVIKLHPNTQDFDVADPRIETVVQHCADKSLVILFDSYKPWDASEMGKFLLLSAKHPQARLILAHMGFAEFRETMTFAEMHKLGIASNVWFDLSAIGVAYAKSPVAPELVWTVRQVGVDHFLFGSDWPVDTPAAAAQAIRDLGFDAAEQKLIFHDNAASLLGLP